MVELANLFMFYFNSQLQFYTLISRKVMLRCFWVSLIYKDYHIAFFLSHPLLALGPDISAREPVGSRADIRTKGQWGIRYEKGHVMIFLSYTWHKKKFLEIDEIQCDTDYRKVYDISWNRVIYFLYQLAKVISGRCLMHFMRF